MLEIVKEIGNNGGWYNALKLARFWNPSLLKFVIGGRGMGKTDYWLQVAIRLYEKFGCQTVWIRNKKVELSEEGNYSNFLNDAKAFGWCPDSWESREDGVFDAPGKDAEQVIKFASISTFSNKRGAGHPNVMLMVFDEMIPEDRKYPKMCAHGLISLIASMSRGRCKVIVCSNYVSAGNPYWAKLEIYNNPKYDVTNYPDKACCIEVAKGYNKATKEDSDFAKVARAGHMPQYEDEKCDSLLGLVAPIPKGAKPAPYVYLIDGQYFREWDKGGLRYIDAWKGEIKASTIIFTPNVTECTEGVQLIPKAVMRYLTENMERNFLRFKTPNVMFKVLNMIYDRI